MLDQDVLTVRESKSTTILGMLVCMVILVVAAFSLDESFRWAAIGSVVLMSLFIVSLLLLASLSTTLSQSGISRRFLYRSWTVSWSQIESWGLDYFQDGSYSIFFVVRGDSKRRYIQALGDDQRSQVKAFFERKAGRPAEQPT